MSIQEAVDMEKADALHRLFSPEVFGKLPSTGRSRVRKTALGVIGTHSVASLLPKMSLIIYNRCLLLLVCSASPPACDFFAA